MKQNYRKIIHKRNVCFEDSTFDWLKGENNESIFIRFIHWIVWIQCQIKNNLFLRGIIYFEKSWLHKSSEKMYFIQRNVKIILKNIFHLKKTFFLRKSLLTKNWKKCLKLIYLIDSILVQKNVYLPKDWVSIMERYSQCIFCLGIRMSIENHILFHLLHSTQSLPKIPVIVRWLRFYCCFVCFCLTFKSVWFESFIFI